VAEERELRTINDIECLIGQHGEMHRVIEEAVAGLQFPATSLGNIKKNLGIDRDIDSDIQVATEEYNIVTCQQLAKLLIDKLPRELRDVVYQHLVPRRVKRIYTVMEVYLDTCVEREYVCGYGPYIPISPLSIDNTLCSGHFWRTEVIGVNMARELVESFYRYAMFSGTRHSSTSSVLPFLLKNDRFNMGLNPQSFIGNFEHRFFIEDEQMASGYEASLWRKATLDGMEALFLLKKKASIRLKIEIHESRLDPDYYVHLLDNLMELIFAGLLSLRRAAYRITIKLCCSLYEEETRPAFARWMERLETEKNGSKAPTPYSDAD
jgi:hypothetical protein